MCEKEIKREGQEDRTKDKHTSHIPSNTYAPARLCITYFTFMNYQLAIVHLIHLNNTLTLIGIHILCCSLISHVFFWAFHLLTYVTYVRYVRRRDGWFSDWWPLGWCKRIWFR